jgi:hypothetical protein
MSVNSSTLTLSRLNPDTLDHKYHVYGDGGRPFAGKYYRKRPAEALVLPAPLHTTEGTYDNTPYPSSVEETCVWLTERPFKTMQRAMHLAYPDTTRWWLDETEAGRHHEEVVNHALWRTYLWRFHPDEHQRTWWRDVPEVENGAKAEPAPQSSIAVVVQPPWILSLQDMKNFTNCRSVGTMGTVLEFAFTIYCCSCLRYRMTRLHLKVGLIALAVFGRICLILAHATNVGRLSSRPITVGCLGRFRKTGHLRG